MQANIHGIQRRGGGSLESIIQSVEPSVKCFEIKLKSTQQSTLPYITRATRNQMRTNLHRFFLTYRENKIVKQLNFVCFVCYVVIPYVLNYFTGINKKCKAGVRLLQQLWAGRVSGPMSWVL